MRDPAEQIRKCPFCYHGKFDEWGLKYHLTHGKCEVYNGDADADARLLADLCGWKPSKRAAKAEEIAIRGARAVCMLPVTSGMRDLSSRLDVSVWSVYRALRRVR